MKASEKLSVVQHVTALAAIRTAPLRHVGLAPVHDGSTRLVAAVPIDPTANVNDELDYALDAALSYWPACTDWTILNCDQVSDSDDIPPDFVVMHSPQAAGAFSSY